jgi:hypothetical protein
MLLSASDSNTIDNGITIPSIVKKQTYQGAWLLVDIGYLASATTVPPFKTTGSRIEIRFLLWLESMRKDVKCTFGILKGRWQILKTGIRLIRVECADKIFLACCALHNWLLETDGLSTSCNNGIPTIDSKWDGPLGEHHPEDNCIIPQAVRNIHNPLAIRTFDFLEWVQEVTLMKWTMFTTTTETIPGTAAIKKMIPIAFRNLSLADFRKRFLITHFNIAY